MNDFEVHPIGTAQRLAELQYLVWDLLDEVDKVRCGHGDEDWQKLNKADESLRVYLENWK